MCNYLKNGSTVHLIPKSGHGYKIFIKNMGKDKILTTPYRGKRIIRNKWYKWNNYYNGDGFCFFRTVKDMKDFYNSTIRRSTWWTKHTSIYKIQYKKGLGKRYESDYISSLCKEYIVLEKINVNI